MAITPRGVSDRYGLQWDVTGSRRKDGTLNVYTVSLKYTAVIEGKFVEPLWSCGCKAWTSKVPRECCKHIFQVKLMMVENAAYANQQFSGKVEDIANEEQPKGRRIKFRD